MLVVNDIRNNQEKVIAGLNKRGFKNPEATVETILTLDEDRRRNKAALDDVLAEGNAISKEIGNLMREGKRAAADVIKEKTATLKETGKTLQEKQSKIEQELLELLYTVPNIPNENVPEGKTPEENVIVKEHGEIPTLHKNKKPHWELIKDYDIIDFELGIKITGAGFPVYKGKGARLQRSLVNFFLDEAVKSGYAEVQPPIVINEASGYGTGQLPDKEGQMYFIKEENFYLIPTAEVPITNMYRDVILKAEELPIKHAGFTPCFRREAGSWGAHVRGLNRLHQFDKVEIVQITHPDKSWEALEAMKSHVLGLLEKLELPYRVLNLCAGDLGFTPVMTFDMEVFSAAQEKWLEVSSVSNFETYQTNRLKLRFKGENKKTELLHTLNGSALALPRIMAAILENNQVEDGINIPKVLWNYTGFKKIE